MRHKRNLVLILITAIAVFYAHGYGEEKTLTLEECLIIADKNNPELISQEYKIKEMNSKENQEIGNILPQIDGNMSYLRYDWQPPSKKALFGPSLDDYYAEVSLKQILFSGGKNIAKIKSADAMLNAEKQRYELIRRAVHLSVKRAFYELSRAQFALQTQQELIDKLNEQYRITQLLYKSGKTSNLDVLKIQTQLASAEDALDNLKNLVYTKSLLLGQAMGINEPVNIATFLPELNENIKINTNCVDDEFTDNPELKYIAELLKKAEYDISVESGEKFPTIFFRANYFWEDKTFFPDHSNWYVGVGLSMPLFHGGAIISKINQAKYRKNQVAESQKQVELNLNVRFQSARATVIDKLNRLKTIKRVLDLSKETLIAAELKYNTGKITATELLDAQTMWLNSKLNYINNILDCQVSLAEIEYICPEAISQEEKK
jgi:outer membrane protein TolC